MIVAVACDHAGYDLKKKIIKFLQNSGYGVLDCGANSAEPVDYPDTIGAAARAVAANEAERGVAICGSGIGASIVANKVRGIRCALCTDTYDAEYSRMHNNANMIAMGARKVRFEKAQEILIAWFSAEFEGGRHEARVAKIHVLEEEECRS